MKRQLFALYVLASLVLFAFVAKTPAFAEDGKVLLHISPEQAYIFVDGRAISEASKHRSLKLSAGDHKIEIVNYGYVPDTRTITINAGQYTDLNVTLAPVSTQTVSSPFGAITVEHADRDAVLLNGKTPDFFVGHGDEFDHDWWWKQELVVPPGTYQMTVLHEDKEVWSGPITVPVNQRVVVDIPKGVRKTVAWHRWEHLQSAPRFAAGSASTTVAVAKPSAELTVASAQINCGDSSQVKWSSSDAPQVEITPIGTVGTSGQQAVNPKQTTTYALTATGPGGTATSNATVNVNSAVQADLGISPAEVRYKRVGDQVVEEGSSALNWNATNASAVSLDPFGTVDSNGTRALKIAPTKTDPGAVDETVTYTLTAKNDCGGTETKTATLHITGSIEPPELALRSVFFPTDRPQTLKSEDALLASEQETLKSVASEFQNYLKFKPDAHLVLVGHADKRGPQAYNQPLSERRVQLAKSFLVEQGVPESNIDTEAYGSDKNLSADEVKQLLDQNSNVSPEQRDKLLARPDTIVLAYNRRVDVNLTPGDQQSAREYPLQAQDFSTLVDRNGPKTSNGVELAAKREKVSN
jgi:outer membrane protein OmpA-like peptidoglycan-associated protein